MTRTAPAAEQLRAAVFIVEHAPVRAASEAARATGQQATDAQSAGTQRAGAGPLDDPRAAAGDPGTGSLDLRAVGLDEEPPTLRPAAAGIPRPRVTAIVVCHNGETFLPRVLAAIGAQTRRPDLLVAVDAGSTDRGGDLLAAATPLVLRLPGSASFGDAVDAALAAVVAGSLRPAPDPRIPMPDLGADEPREAGTATGGRVTDWLWLLHDDAAAAPDALEHLLGAIELAPSAAVAGCKQVDWQDQAQLLDVGFSVSALGRRVTGVEVREVDQGQHDARSDVLAVGTAGMLIRRDVWEVLGGPDPALAHARDDEDLCRRARLAGHRVIVVPGAVMAHARARSQGRRGGRDSRRRWLRAERSDAVHLRLAGVPWPLLLPALLWTLLVSPLRAAVRLVLKRPDLAVDELLTPAAVILAPAGWWRARRRSARGRRVPARVLRGLVAPPKQRWRARRDALGAHLEATAQVDEAPAEAVLSESVTSDQDEPVRRVRPGGVWAPLVVLIVAAGGGLLALRAVLGGPGRLTGVALLPVPSDVGRLWTLATSSWRPVGLGAAAPADPLAAVLAGLGLLGGSPAVATEVLLVAAPPLAALTGWLAAGLVIRSRLARAWAALVWAAAAPLTGAVAAGRVGPVLAHLTLPVLLVVLARATGHPPATAPGGRAAVLPGPGRRWRRPGGRGAVTAASGAGLLLTLALAAAPSLTLPALVCLALAAIWARSGRWLLSWTLLVPAVLLLPWWTAVARHPRLLLADPGGGDIATGSVPAPSAEPWGSPWWHLLGTPERADRLLGVEDGLGLLLRGPLKALPWHPGTASVVAVVAVSATLAALGLALYALFRRATDAILACWCVVASGLVTAAACDQLGDGAGQRGPWPGPATSVLLLGLLGAALLGLRGGSAALRGFAARCGRPGRLLPALAGLALLAGPVTGLAGWAWAGAGTGAQATEGARPLLRRVDPTLLPAVAAAGADGPDAARTLVLRDQAGALHWTLARGDGPQLGESSTALLAEALDARDGSDPSLFAPVLTGLLSGSGQDVRQQLEALGVGAVLLLPAAGPVGRTAEAGQSLDVSPGLNRVGGVRQGGGQALLWRVQPDADDPGMTARPARARVIDRAGRVLADLPSVGLEIDTSLGSGRPGRILVLAERWDPGWGAEVDGTPLPSLRHDGWAQAFRLPAGGGRLRVAHHSAGQRRLDLARAAIAALALLVAVPVPGRRRRLGPPRTSTPVTRGPLTRAGGP